jgi:ABC-2 type transport system ATP-binding protein
MAIEEALRRHIAETLSRGATRKDVQALLVRAGWPREIIGEYLSQVEEHLPSPALVRLKDVSKRFGQSAVLDRVSLDLVPGELFGIIGLSGSGKTTLLNVMVGFFEPDAGDVTLLLPDGTEVKVSQGRDIVKTMFGFAAQTPSFYGRLSVRENIEHFAALYNIPSGRRIARCNELLRLVGLEDAQHTLAQNLSGGMQKRLDIACAIVHEPAILILDEPTADLDPLIRNQLWELITSINRQGTTVVVASHVVSELEQYCSKIAILRNKRITEIGTTAQLRDIYSTKYEIFLTTAKHQYAKLHSFCARNRSLFSKPTEKAGQFVVQTSRPQEALQQILKFLAQAREQVVHVHVDRPSIAEVFEALVRHDNTHPFH